MSAKNYIELEKLVNKYNPREKIIELGPTSLRDSELLSNIFITGYKGEDSLELSERILSDYGNKPILKIKSIQEIMETVGLPPVKACQLLSALELGKRFFSPEYGNFPTIRSPEDAYKCFTHMESYKKETLEAIYLNARNKVIYREVICIGTIEKTYMDPGEIFEPAIASRALGVIIAHNHPSGDWKPSEGDHEATQEIQKAGDILRRPLLDHLVIGEGGYHSLVHDTSGCAFEV